MLAVNNLRKGSTYCLVNYGESCVFEVLEFIDDENYRIKDINTLEVSTLSEFLYLGKGKDFNLVEFDPI